MTKSMENLIVKVVTTTGNNVRLLEKIEFSNGLTLSDCVECISPFKGGSLYICSFESNEIMVFNESGSCVRNVWKDEYKTQIEKAVALTMALNQLAF